MAESRDHFIIGFVAGSAALGIMFLFRIFAGGLFIPELAAQTLFSLMPGTVESVAVETLGPLAKQMAFAGAIVANLFLYGLIGVLSHRTYQRLAHKGFVINLSQLSLLSYAILFALAAIMLEVTQFLSQPIPISLTSLYLLPPHIVFGFILYFKFQRQVTEPEMVQQMSSKESMPDLRRRQFLRIAVAGAIGSAIFFSGGGFLFPKPTRTSDIPSDSRVLQPAKSPTDIFADPRLASFVAAEVTPNDRFYKVDVNILTPTINENAWKLNVKGLVNNPLELTYEELKSMPAVEEYTTLECISNKIGEDLISTALWKGVPLQSILSNAQLKPEAAYVVFKCYDGYDVGIPLERALGTILTYEMNGVPLPPEHGFPLRAVVPGIYGMMNAKWITEIEVVDRTYEGFWQRQGWSNNAQYQIHSTIVLPRAALTSRFRDLRSLKTVVGEKVPIAGIAFAGDRGISKVEVSMDDGKSWQEARIKEPLSNYTWVLWATEWIPSAVGSYSIVVRAADKTGKVQTPEYQNAFPNGSTGYHRVDINVEAS
jgi:DMSO/TMAO reductase YedYZ molybdopterin-dependent catalytic subunit